MNYADPNGPAVILGASDSIFPRQLSADWRSLSLNVTLVTRNKGTEDTTENGVRLIHSKDFETGFMRSWQKILRPFLGRVEKYAIRLSKSHYQKHTGRQEPDPWEPYFMQHFFDSFPAARAVKAQHPRFVFAQEVGAYGLPAVYCQRVPKILFPWGADIYLSAETSPLFYALIKYALKRADLIMPSSTKAGEHIIERFGISASKVKSLSWGVDLKMFKPADPLDRVKICQRWGIDPDKHVLMNVRRFKPSWGCFTALKAFMLLAYQDSQVHFVMLGGQGSEEYIRQARQILAQNGISERFTLIEENIPLGDVAELMSISEVYVSLLGRGDMRSASVLQAAAAGGVPVVSDHPEHRTMEKQGFRGIFVDPENVEETARALNTALSEKNFAHQITAENKVYLAAYEDHQRQMCQMLDIIDGVCDSFYHHSRG